MGSLIIAFQSPGRKPVSIATVDDPTLLGYVAGMALQQAQQKAAAERDPISARVQSLEASRLRATLEVIIPGFKPLDELLPVSAMAN